MLSRDDLVKRMGEERVQREEQAAADRLEDERTRPQRVAKILARYTTAVEADIVQHREMRHTIFVVSGHDEAAAALELSSVLRASGYTVTVVDTMAHPTDYHGVENTSAYEPRVVLTIKW